MNILNSFEIENEIFYYYDLEKVFTIYESLRHLPISLKILLEENLRKAKTDDEIEYIIDVFLNKKNSLIKFYPSRVIMQDFIGLPILIDFASIRDKFKEMGKDVNQINPSVMVDLIIDNSLDEEKLKINLQKQKEEYRFIKWAQNSFKNLRVIPPSGIYHQINLEYLSTIIHLEQIDGKNYLFSETIVGTNSNSSLINSLGILGCKVGGIEVESAILGLPISFNLPKVIGVKISKKLTVGITSSDLVFTIKEILTKYELADKIIEFYGESISELTLEDRAILSNDILKSGAKFAFFPIDDKTLLYYDNTRDNSDFSNLIKTYLKKQKLFLSNENLSYDEKVEIDLELIEPNISDFKTKEKVLIDKLVERPILNEEFVLKDGDIILAQIISKSLNSNPYSLIHAGLVAKKIFEIGLKSGDNIKKIFKINCSFVKDYLSKLDLLKYFEELGFDIIDNDSISSHNEMNNILEDEIIKSSLNLYSVSFGNKNFEEKLQPFIKSDYLMSASLVVVYSLAKTIKCNVLEDCIERIGEKEIRLRDIWPNNELVVEYLNKLDYSLYKDIYKNIFIGNDFWKSIEVINSDTYIWDEDSTYVQASKICDEEYIENIEIKDAGIVAILGDKVSTEYISPLGQIALYSSAASYLEQKGVKSYDYNTFASRYANAEVMIRSIFDSVMLKNEIVSKEGGFSKDFEKNEIVSIYELAKRFKEKNKDAVIFAGEEYGKGNSKIWAAKGTKLLGIKAVIAKSFDEIHRLDLIKVGVLPLQFLDDEVESFNLKGNEIINIKTIGIIPNEKIEIVIKNDNRIRILTVKSRLDTNDEVIYYKNRGILNFLFNGIIL